MVTSPILWSIALVVGTYLFVRMFKRLLGEIARRKNVQPKRLFYIEKVFEILFVVAGLFAMAFIWSVDIKGLSVVASSVFAIIGVAMFAQWSILSNVTASIIIFFTFPARVGDRVRILDGDDSVEGIIMEIALFQTELKNDDGHMLFYPNNLLLQKPVLKLNSRADKSVNRVDS
jgi:small-conductance mechanosensitive channel